MAAMFGGMLRELPVQDMLVYCGCQDQTVTNKQRVAAHKYFEVERKLVPTANHISSRPVVLYFI